MGRAPSDWLRTLLAILGALGELFGGDFLDFGVELFFEESKSVVDI